MVDLVTYLSEHTIPKSFWKQLLIPLNNNELSDSAKLAYINGMIDTRVLVTPELAYLKFFPVRSLLLVAPLSTPPPPSPAKKRKIAVSDDNTDDENQSDAESVGISGQNAAVIGEIYKEVVNAKTTRFFRVDALYENNTAADITWVYSYADMIAFFDSRKLQDKSDNIKATYHANVLWISTHKQRDFVLGDNIENIQSDIVFKPMDKKRQSQRGKYQLCEVFDLDTMNIYPIPIDADGICWTSRFDGYIDNLLARGLQHSTSLYTVADLKAMLSQTPRHEFIITPFESPIRTRCDICSMQRHIKETISVVGYPKLYVGSSCKQHLVTAHEMLHYQEYGLDPYELEKQFKPT
jgi:hypothetical protein